MVNVKKWFAVLLAAALVAGSASPLSIDGKASELETVSETDQTPAAGEQMPAAEEDTNEEEAGGETAPAEEDTKKSESATDPDGTEQQEETDNEFEGQDLGANSWRYTDGIPDNYDSGEGRSRANASANAWKKVDGKYISSNGSVIEGATMKGVDVSSWQGKIDWNKVKADGIDFAILRCATGYENNKYNDKYWEYNASECERLGIPYGVYFYSYATNEAQAAAEADHTLSLLKGRSLTLPVYYDLEDACVEKTGKNMITKMAKAYCDKISAAGYRVGIYSSLSWWNTYLTDPVFDNSNWSKWIAQWNVKCTYKGNYDAWQCTSTGKVDGINGNVDLNFWMSNAISSQAVSVEDRDIIRTQAHMQTYGWISSAANGYQSGMTGLSKRMEAFRIEVGEGYGDLGIQYAALVQGGGWQNYVSNGETAGTTGEGKWMEAVKIRLTGTEAQKYDIYYRVHSQSYGWLGWTSNDKPAGTNGYDKRIEAIQVAVLPKGSEAPGSAEQSYVDRPATVRYQTYVNGTGWQTAAENGAVSGTVGKAKILEGIKIGIVGSDVQGGISYNAYMQGKGWTGETSDQAQAGLPGTGKRLEAVQIKLTGELAEKYDVYYRTHCQSFGWLDWAKNGETAGTMGYAKRLEAIEIQLVAKGGAAPGKTESTYKEAKIKYLTHVQTYGWQNWVMDGAASGTTGQAKRLEAIRIVFPDGSKNSEIRYKTHVQTYGWQDWVSGGNVSGTSGKAKRLEAIQIELSGSMKERYDIYYRVHSQTYGWLDWAKNGERAGTEGLAKRLESIEIVLVDKGGNAPGSTTRPYVAK